MNTSTLETVIRRAAADADFRRGLLADADQALAGAGFTLSVDDRATLDEYRRVARDMSDDEIAEAIKVFFEASGSDRRSAAII